MITDLILSYSGLRVFIQYPHLPFSTWVACLQHLHWILRHGSHWEPQASLCPVWSGLPFSSREEGKNISEKDITKLYNQSAAYRNDILHMLTKLSNNKTLWFFINMSTSEKENPFCYIWCHCVISSSQVHSCRALFTSMEVMYFFFLFFFFFSFNAVAEQEHTILSDFFLFLFLHCKEQECLICLIWGLSYVFARAVFYQLFFTGEWILEAYKIWCTLITFGQFKVCQLTSSLNGVLGLVNCLYEIEWHRSWKAVRVNQSRKTKLELNILPWEW